MDNYKLAFISYEDGSIDKIGLDKDNNGIHINYLLEYINKKFPNIELFKKFNQRHDPGTVAFFIAKMGYIVFFNTTRNIDYKHGTFIFPDKISEIQKKSLYQFIELINDYKISIEYDSELIDGVIESKIVESNYNNPYESVEKYFDLKNNNKTI